MKGRIRIYPPARAPDEPLEGKFLQLRWFDREYLLLADVAECRYHNQMLARFALEWSIPHHWKSPECLEVASAEVRVIGGGRFRLDPVQGGFQVWDASGVYGPFDPGLLARQLASAGPPWDGFVLRVL